MEVDGVGGSTGRPKLIEAGGDSRVPAAIGYPLGAQEGDVNLLSVPLSHNTGFTTFAIGLLQGHHLVLMPRFDPEEFLRLVTEHRVTFLATVPTIMQRLLPVYRADPDAYDLSSIRGSGIWRHRARRRSSRRGSTCSARRWSGNCTAAPNYRR